MDEYIELKTVLEHAEYDNNYRLIIPVEAIKAVPAADVAPVVHGRWVPTESPFMNECEDCSVCGYRTVWGTGTITAPTAAREWTEVQNNAKSVQRLHLLSPRE